MSVLFLVPLSNTNQVNTITCSVVGSGR